MKRTRHFFMSLLILASSLLIMSQPIYLSAEARQFNETGAVQKPAVKIIGNTNKPGGAFTVFISNAAAGDKVQVTSTLTKETPAFYKYGQGLVSVIGINMRTKAGSYPVKVKVIRDKKVILETQQTVKILSRSFETQYMTVTKKQKEQRSQENLNMDQVYIDKAKSNTATKALWDGTFIMPVKGKISTGFGLIRYINKEESGRHSGWDISAPKGTPIKAGNNGVVRLAMLLEVTGNTVIIDHGFNVYTSYCHMDKMDVKVGQAVKKGDIIGKVGSTGFSTGPHLHWTLTIDKTYVDPDVFIKDNPLKNIPF